MLQTRRVERRRPDRASAGERGKVAVVHPALHDLRPDVGNQPGQSGQTRSDAGGAGKIELDDGYAGRAQPLDMRISGKPGEMAPAARAGSLRAAPFDRSAENGLCGCRLMRGCAARYGTGRKRCSKRHDWLPVVSFASRRSARLAGAPQGHAQLAISAVDRVDAPSLAREVGVRPAKIIYVTSDLFIGGGAEAMLMRLVTAAPAVADEIIVVSLLPGDWHVERLRAAGITVIQLDFGGAAGIASGLARLVKLIADARPQIVQGWMYHGDLAALTALALSGRRRSTQSRLEHRCSNMDLQRYGFGLRLVVRACSALSRLPDVITANSAAGLKCHLSLGYRPRRVEMIANGIDVAASSLTRGRAPRSGPSSALPTLISFLPTLRG